MSAGALLGRWSGAHVISSLSFSQWEGEPEGGALARCALDADLPAVGLDDRLADVQPDPQPDPGSTLNGDPRRPVETLPNERLIGNGHADALVAHPDPPGLAARL